jgi:hypothetical protein
MSATEECIDRRADVTALATLGAALGAGAEAFGALAPPVSLLWALAQRALLDLARHSGGADSEAELLLVDAAADPLAPPWLIVDGVIALIVEQLAIDTPPPVVVEVDRSLAGLRRLGAVLRQPDRPSW